MIKAQTHLHTIELMSLSIIETAQNCNTSRVPDGGADVHNLVSAKPGYLEIIEQNWVNLNSSWHIVFFVETYPILGNPISDAGKPKTTR